MPEIVLWDDADDKLLDQFENALDLAQTAIEDLPARPESRALDDVRQVASRIVVHESCDCWFDCYVMLLIAGTLYRLLVEFKPCLQIYTLGWLSSVVSGLQLVDIHSKDQARVLGPNFHGEPRDKWPDTASILVSTGAALLLVNRATLAVSYGGLQALVNNFLRLYNPCKPQPGFVWLTTPEPFNYLVVDDGGAEVYFLVFEAGGAFLEARVHEPVRKSGAIVSLGGVRRRIKTLKDTAKDAGLKHEVELGRFVTHMILSNHESAAVFIGTIDETLDDAIERKFRRFEPPADSPFLVLAAWFTGVLSEVVRDAYAAETPTLEQRQILADERKAIASLSGSAAGMAGADERATNVALSSLLVTGQWYVEHPFDAGAVRDSGHHALHPETYAWAHDCKNREDDAKRKLGEEAGTLVYKTPGGDEIRARDAAWQAGHRPTVALIYYEKDDSGSIEAQVLKQADALDVVEAMAADDDEEEEAEEEESEEEEKSDAPPAQRARTTS